MTEQEKQAAATIRRDWSPNLVALVGRCAKAAEECDVAIDTQDFDATDRALRRYNCCRDQLRWLGVDEELVEDAIIGRRCHHWLVTMRTLCIGIGCAAVAWATILWLGHAPLSPLGFAGVVVLGTIFGRFLEDMFKLWRRK